MTKHTFEIDITSEEIGFESKLILAKLDEISKRLDLLTSNPITAPPIPIPEIFDFDEFV